MSKKHAATYRRLARGAEKIEAAAMEREEGTSRNCYQLGPQSPFTCNAVCGALGWRAGEGYRAALVEENDLWRQPDCPSIRVLMLCFAAAMAETGDL